MLKKCSAGNLNENSPLNKRTVAFIPVRGGSKSIPHKNIQLLCGKPLVYWVVEAAQSCPEIDSIFVSTDCPQIKAAVEKFEFEKVKVIGRSAFTATDEATTESAMLEFAHNEYFEDVVLIQATSPLTTVEDLTKAIRLYRSGESDSLVSVTRQKRFQWACNENGALPLNYIPANRPRRQEWQGFFVENGAIYISSKTALLQSQVRLSGRIAYYEMPESTYFEIDEPEDWEIIENLKWRQIKKSKESSLDFSQINLLVSDVDGVLTDAGMYYSENGDELKKFNTKDGKGIELLRASGIKVMILTAEDRLLVKRRAEKLKADYLYMGIMDKKTLLDDFFEEHPEYSYSKTAYIGDDLNDEECMKNCRIAAVPSDGMITLRQYANYTCLLGGGMGCVREVCEWILKGRNHD